MKEILSLQTGVVYGPMDSRRFGSSLGINLSGDQKTCSYDCVYCQYGRTDYHQSPDFPDLRQIEEEAGAAFSVAGRHSSSPDWIMIAGNGEPTLHPDLDAAVEMLKKLRDRYLFDVPIGVLSNSSTCYRPDIQKALLKLDGRYMKLDAGNPEVFLRINQPCAADSMGRIVSGLYQLRNIVLQSLFVAGRVDNTAPEMVEDWIRVVDYIRPASVQVYTLDRATAEPDLLPVSKRRLQEIAELMTLKTRVPAMVY